MDTSELPQWAGLRVREGQIPLGLDFEWGPYEAKFQTLGPSGTAGITRRHLPPIPPGIQPWITVSSQGEDTLWLAHKMAQTPMNMYLAGETGVGKEIMARLVHAWSDRASAPFVALNCAALQTSLAESELFGHLKGAFTGAESTRQGALLTAHNGTLFLDEIADLSLEVQAKLLRFLENGEIRPLGSDRISFANVRVLCATHKDLKEKVEDGTFRRDLYFRVASLCIQIPPLRERPEDIVQLCKSFAHKFQKVLHPDAVLRLRVYPWPGNVRELRHAIERACGFAHNTHTILRAEEFDFLMDGNLSQRAHENYAIPRASLSLAEMEKQLLIEALKKTRGNRSETARVLGVGRSTVFQMLKRYKINGREGYLITPQ